MLDSAIFTLLQTVLPAGLTARSVSGINVMRNQQPRQFAAPSAPTIFYTYGSRKKFGWPVARDVVNGDGSVTTTTTQVVHTRMQIAGVAFESPGNPNGYTSGDIASIANDILQHESAIAQFVAADCNVFRVSDNPAVWFQDSNAQNVLWASFDIIFTHKDAFVTSTAAISEFNPTVNNV